MFRFISVFCFLVILFFHSCSQSIEHPKEEKRELINYLKNNWRTPEEYVIEKFLDYDIIFIGEYHRIKHDVKLIHNLIPRLYEIGVYDLGMEFGCYEYQDKVDSLITAEEYDENLARSLMFKSAVYWGYKEYIDIYRKAWKLNKSLPKDAPKFRVVNLKYRADWRYRKEEMTPELWKKVWHKGDPDEHMAQVIMKEFLKKGRKALIYSGSHHAFTHYYQPRYDFESKRLIGLNKNRMGNIVYTKIPDRVFNIFLHSPWPTKENFEKHNYPVGGIIDEVMKEFKEKRVGFDVKGSPFGKLRDDNTYYSIGYENFTLSTFCDGYIFQKHFSDYEGCTVDTLFVTKENLREVIEYLPNPKARAYIKQPQDQIEFMIKDANMKRRFHNLE